MKKTHTLFDRQIWGIFVQPGEVVEVRIPLANGKLSNEDFIRNRTVAGYFDNHRDFCRWVHEADENLSHTGIYFTLQVIDPRLIGRAFNRLKATQFTTSDNNVKSYRWLLIDCDPERPSGVSSSDIELKNSLQVRDHVADYVVKEFNFPHPIKAMSGNGGHALFKLPDIPANDENKLFLKSILNKLAEQFDSDMVKVDRTVFNPSRITKVYGTRTGKGDAVPSGKYREERPHRVSYIQNLGEAYGNEDY